MDGLKQAEQMITLVASALGPDILNEVAFVGGCTTGLFVTDTVSKQNIRFTDDVDLIVNVMSTASWFQFQENLRALGFTESMEDNVNCRMRLGELKVDFMPDDEEILGYSNRWYEQALASAELMEISNRRKVRVVTPCYFLATKFEAYKGRGNGDPLSSRDMEDILTVIDGRPQLIDEINQSSEELSQYLAIETQALLKNNDFEYAVSSAANNVREREPIIFQRLETIARIS